MHVEYLSEQPQSVETAFFVIYYFNATSKHYWLGCLFQLQHRFYQLFGGESKTKVKRSFTSESEHVFFISWEGQSHFVILYKHGRGKKKSH